MTSAAVLLGLILAVPALAAPAGDVNPFGARMRLLAPADRDGALRRAVTLEGQRCGRLSTSRDRGAYGNLAAWQVRCAPGGDYTVFLGGNGEVQVRRCADMARLKLPACVAPWDVSSPRP